MSRDQNGRSQKNKTNKEENSWVVVSKFLLCLCFSQNKRGLGIKTTTLAKCWLVGFKHLLRTL